ncbi:MAG: M23 family metallopeptidase [Chloroflexi bacterium]|nr:M23 family metallopeptidase [Chloroflexota bacterium]
MSHLFVRLSVVLCMLFATSPGQAQNTGTDALLFVWNDAVFAQSVTTGELIATGREQDAFESLQPKRHGNVYTSRYSLTAVPPADGYGLVQGVWTPDRTELAYLAIQPDGPEYRVVIVEDDVHHVWLAGEVGPERGYLVPLGWSDDGALIALERHSLYTLDRVRLWQIAGPDQAPVLRHESSIPELKGNSAALQGGWAFIGFDVVGVLGYSINMNTGQLISFRTQLALQTPPSVFETYPIQVIGVVDSVQLDSWLNEPAPISQESHAALWESGPPFLSWPLPDHARSVTCYPDSAWTDLNYSVECPGLATPREYQGHEGTDVGGRPNGLELGTPVYAAAPGLVVTRNTGCSSEDITCGDAYGNYILIEHSRVVGSDVLTWFTGYAHLMTVLVEQHAYVREIGGPIALSGDTGLGGAHLHFEVRAPHHPARTNWLDPWDARLTSDGEGLWIGGAAYPSAAVTTAPPAPQRVCRTIDGNNIRRGPGTEYDVIAKSQSQVDYEVYQIQAVQAGETPGEWYYIGWDQLSSTGWIWADLMRDCEPDAAG